MLNIFKRKHKHKWQEESYLNKRNHMIWYLRRCKCSAVEILNAGGTGDKKWHPFTGEFKFDWEKIWFEEATLQPVGK